MENLGWGLQMTVLGMGLVFALLALLWVLLTVVLKLDNPDEEEEPVSPLEAQDEAEHIAAQAKERAAGQEIPVDLAAAITVAVVQHRTECMPSSLVAAITVAVAKHKSNLQGKAAPVTRTFWPGTYPGTQTNRWVAAGRVRQTNNWNPRGK